METSRRNSSVSTGAQVKTTEVKKHIISGNCTFVRLIYGDNQILYLNSYASCRRLLDHMKPIVGVQQDEIIDLMDNEGKLKDLNTHYDEYASQYLAPRNTYYVLKVEIDTSTGERRYTANFNFDHIDQKLYSTLQNSLNALNKSKDPKPTKRPVIGTTKPSSSVQSASNTAQTKRKTPSNKK